MDISFDLLLSLLLAIFAQAFFLAMLQVIGYYLEQGILSVVRLLLSTLI